MEKELKQEPSNCLKIVLFGPESTGKTTMAKKLAEHFCTKWAPEYMREYLQPKFEENGHICGKDDILPIAKGQMEQENKLAKSANKVLFCDTNLLELKVYSEIYFNGYCDEKLLKPALNNCYDLYFLTNIDVPWTPDDLRDKPNDREKMFHIFETELIRHQKSYIVLSGDVESRMKTAIQATNKLLKAKK